MSLVSLSSNSSKIQFLTQRPFDFQNHFPQPLILEPDSEVCLTNLTFGNPGDNDYVIRGGQNPSINDGNNKLAFSFGDKGYYGLDIAMIKEGKFTGSQLATEIAVALNNACRFEYYEFSCVYAVGNPNANNPGPTNDTFTISYTERAGLNPANIVKGDWVKNSLEPAGNTLITDGGAMGGTTHDSTKIQLSQAAVVSPNPDLGGQVVAQAISVQKGIPFYSQATGGGFFEATINCFGEGTTTQGDPEIESKIIGLAAPSQIGRCGFDGGVVDDAGIEYDNAEPVMELKCKTFMDALGVNYLQIYYTLPQNYDDMPIGDQMTQFIMRKINLTGIITAKTDVLLVRLSTFYRARAYVVQLLKSTDGDSFSIVAPNTGGNNTGQFLIDGSADGRMKVYSDTMIGMATGANNHPPMLTGVVYSTIGLPDTTNGIGGGTGIGDARVGSVNNGFTPQIAYPVPFIQIPQLAEDGVAQKTISGLNLGNDTGDTPCVFQQDLNGAQGTTAGNRYSIQTNNNVANGFDGTISIALNPTTTDDSAVPTAQILNMAYKQTTRQINKWLVYPDNSQPIANSVSSGNMVINLATNAIVITSTAFTSGHPFTGSLAGDPPSLITEEPYALVSMISNTRDSLLYQSDTNFRNGRYQFYMKGNTPAERGGTVPGLPFGDDPDDRFNAVQDAASGDVAAGSTLNEIFSGRLGRITEQEVEQVGENVAFRRLREEEPLEANAGRTLGYGELSFENAINDRNIVGTIAPLKDASQTERTVHISIPELSNVKSLEGESNQRYKTIKVLPKDTFSEDTNESRLTYEANYEDWIKINNGRETQINELTLQIRQPDGTLADWITGDCRATIKFRESPEKAQMRLFDRLAERMAQKENPGQALLVRPGDFVGS